MLWALGSWTGSTCRGGARRAVASRSAAQWRSTAAPVTRREPCVIRASLARPPPEATTAPAASTGPALNLSSTLSKTADSSAAAQPGSEWPAPERPATASELSPWTVLRGAWQSQSFHEFMLHAGKYKSAAHLLPSARQRALSARPPQITSASPAADRRRQSHARIRPGPHIAPVSALHTNSGMCEPSTATWCTSICGQSCHRSI